MRYFPILTVVVFLIVGWIPKAHAAPAWYVCDIHATGVSNTEHIFVRLTDTASPPTFKNKWFIADAKVKNEMLATALSAITADLKLWIKADIDAASPPVIQRMYARNF